LREVEDLSVTWVGVVVAILLVLEDEEELEI
jgi:hypothetical protein